MPESNQVHIDAALTNLSVAYRNNDFIAELIAPQVHVRKQSDRYYVYDPELDTMRGSDDHRAPGSLAHEMDYSISTDSYYCDDHALASAVPDEERENADPIIQPDIDRTEFLTERILLNQELAISDKLNNGLGISEFILDPGSEWTNAGSDPIANVQTARMTVFDGCHRRPNVLVLPFHVFEALRHHPAILDRIKYTAVGAVTPDLLAQVFDVDRVLVPRSVKNAAAKGQPAGIEALWGDTAYVMYVAPRPGLKQVTVANTFVWNGMPGSTNGTVVERWREPGRKADMIRVQKYYDLKIIAPGAIYRIKNTVA